jgi:hypothetical protein
MGLKPKYSFYLLSTSNTGPVPLSSVSELAYDFYLSQTHEAQHHRRTPNLISNSSRFDVPAFDMGYEFRVRKLLVSRHTEQTGWLAT